MAFWVDTDPVHVPEQEDQLQVPATVAPSLPKVPAIAILGLLGPGIWNWRFEIAHGEPGVTIMLPDVRVVPPQLRPENVYMI